MRLGGYREYMGRHGGHPFPAGRKPRNNGLKRTRRTNLWSRFRSKGQIPKIGIWAKNCEKLAYSWYKTLFMDIGQAHPDYIKSPHVVLVVDDELFLLEYVRLVLVRSGFRVMTANTGEEAWQLISNPENSISLILTDVVMPGSFDGFELAERIRRRQLGIPVLFMTGALQQEDPNSDSPGSKRAFLQKPFGPDQLITIVRESLKRKPVNTEKN
jgi:CheY-like chemotaxis protein